MSATRKKLDGPVRNGLWGLQVDRLVEPTRVTILRFGDKSRHTRSFVEVATIEYTTIDQLVERTISESGMPSAAARTLVRDLKAKLDSPRARQADSDE